MITFRRHAIVITIGFFCLLPNAYSHVDADIRLGLLGKMKGLPERFQPSSYDRRDAMLRIRADEFKIPPFLQERIEAESCRKIKISASWYHEGKPYLSLRYRNDRGNGYDLSFLLEDLSDPGIYRITATTGGGYKSEHYELSETEEAEVSAAYSRNNS